MSDKSISIFPLGCSGLICYFGDSISPKTNQEVHSFSLIIQSKIGTKFKGIVPSYHSITLYYDSLNYSYLELKAELEVFYEQMNDFPKKREHICFEIPVCYHTQFAPDIERVANANQLTVKDVIEFHQEKKYQIYMIGFLPGFPYLGGLNSKLATQRLIKPKMVEAGSVGIAGEQTGIYPFDSPGGWNIIGRTPISIFSSTYEMFKPGDFLKFKAITELEFFRLKQSFEEGDYLIQKEVHLFD